MKGKDASAPSPEPAIEEQGANTNAPGPVPSPAAVGNIVVTSQSFEFHDAVVGTEIPLTLNVTHSGSPVPIEMAGLNDSIKYRGGTFPGSGGTCANPISASCSLDLAYQTSRPENNGSHTITVKSAKNEFNISVKSSAQYLYGKSGWAAPSEMAGEFALSIVEIVGDKLVGSDPTNNRVLIWNSWMSPGKPDLVLGQKDFFSTEANSGGRSASTFSRPLGIASDGTRLIISDVGNRRVLIWNTWPTENGQPADLVLGQPDFTSDTFVTGVASETNMEVRFGLTTDGTRLYVTDFVNYRVLGWNTFPTGNNQFPDVVLGQPNFTSRIQNHGGISKFSLGGAHDVLISGSRLFVADTTNKRILVWDSFPSTNKAPANFVFGQPNFGSSNAGTSINSLRYPKYLRYDGTRLYVADSINLRVLGFDFTPLTALSNNPNASIVLGQPDFNSQGTNSAGLNASSIGEIGSIAVSDGKLFINDTYNQRIMRWNTKPTSNYQQADAFIFSDDPTTISGRVSKPTRFDLFKPTGLSEVDGRIVVFDSSNHRVLLWSKIEDFPLKAPDTVLGQSSFEKVNVDPIGANDLTFNDPRELLSAGGKYFLVEQGNNRILGWNQFPNAGVTPDFVLGQNSFTDTNAGTGNSRVRGVADLCAIDGKLLVADENNHRIMVFNTIPTTTFAPADLVIGQNIFSANLPNANVTTNEKVLYKPQQVLCIGKKLIVLDSGNNRVLIWNSILDVGNFQPAHVVIGQENFGSAVTDTLNSRMLPAITAIAYDGAKNRLFVAGKNHVLMFEGIPESNYPEGIFVVGGIDSVPGYKFDQFAEISGMLIRDNVLFMVDRSNNRIVGKALP